MTSVLWPGLLLQDGVCLARGHDLHQHVQRATVHADGDRQCRGLPRVALQLSLFDAATDPPRGRTMVSPGHHQPDGHHAQAQSGGGCAPREHVPQLVAGKEETETCTQKTNMTMRNSKSQLRMKRICKMVATRRE